MIYWIPILSCNIPYTRFKTPLNTEYPKTLADPDIWFSCFFYAIQCFRGNTPWIVLLDVCFVVIGDHCNIVVVVDIIVVVVRCSVQTHFVKLLVKAFTVSLFQSRYHWFSIFFSRFSNFTEISVKEGKKRISWCHAGFINSYLNLAQYSHEHLTADVLVFRSYF